MPVSSWDVGTSRWLDPPHPTRVANGRGGHQGLLRDFVRRESSAALPRGLFAKRRGYAGADSTTSVRTVLAHRGGRQRNCSPRQLFQGSGRTEPGRVRSRRGRRVPRPWSGHQTHRAARRGRPRDRTSRSSRRTRSTITAGCSTCSANAGIPPISRSKMAGTQFDWRLMVPYPGAQTFRAGAPGHRGVAPADLRSAAGCRRRRRP